jgi:hypothetical protein
MLIDPFGLPDETGANTEQRHASRSPELYLAQAHAMVRLAKRTPHMNAQSTYLRLALRWERLAHEARAMSCRALV